VKESLPSRSQEILNSKFQSPNKSLQNENAKIVVVKRIQNPVGEPSDY
jgi:hypothetical protein